MQKDERESCGSKLWLSWIRLCNNINQSFSKLFYKWAGICGRHPKYVIAITLVTSLALIAGFARFNTQNSGDRLYFQQSNIATRDMDRSLKSFPSKSRQEMFLLTMKDGSSILNENALKWGLKVHLGILQTDYNDICTRINDSDPTVTGCLYVNILELFNNTEAAITNTSITETLIKSYGNTHYIMKNGRTFQQNILRLLGKVVLQQNGSNLTKIDALALKFEYFSYIPINDDTYSNIASSEKSMLDFWKSQEAAMEADGVLLFYTTFRSLDDNVAESSGGDIKFVVISITLMCTFTAIVMARINDKVSGHLWVGMCGIGCVILGVGSAFGLVMACGQYYVAFVGVLPFLVLGVGIDDMFIIVDAVDHVNKKYRGLERLQIALGEVGASVTMTTVTDLVAFAVSVSSAFPAIEYFCTYAAVAILFSYLMIMSLLISVLSLDIQRIENGQWNLVPCKKVDQYEPWEDSQQTFSSKAMHAWGKFLMKVPVRVCVVAMFFALFGVSVWGGLNVDEKFELKQLATDGSTFEKFLTNLQENFPTQYAISIVQDNPFDYANENNQELYRNLSNVCVENTYFRDDQILSWMNDFVTSPFCNTNRSQCTGHNFKSTLQLFLKEYPMYIADLRFNSTNDIVASRIICFEKNNYEWIWKKDSMFSIRDELNNHQQIPNLYPIHVEYFWREQMAVVRSETLKNLGICAAAIIVITTPYLVHPIVILFTAFGFIALVFELFALMTIWDVALNSISMIVSIMAIGFAVDYSAHVAHAFILAKGDTPEDRMIHALTEVGSSVLKGGISTFIGICMLALGESEIFRIFFRMMFGIVVLGLLNGLLFLPVFLSIFCRKKIDISNASIIYETNDENEVDQNGGRVIQNFSISENVKVSHAEDDGNEDSDITKNNMAIENDNAIEKQELENNLDANGWTVHVSPEQSSS